MALAGPSGCDRDSTSSAPPAPLTSSQQSSGTERATLSDLSEEREQQIIGLIRQGRFGPARVRLRRHLDDYPDDGRAEFLFGLTYHRERHYGQAKPHFERSNSLDPDYAVTSYFLGWCLFYLGDLDAASAAFERHLAAAPLEGDTHFALGLIALEEGRLDDAEASFRRAIGLQEGRTDRRREIAKAHGRLADVFIDRDDLEQARSELETAIALYPDHYESHYKLFRVLTRLGDTDGAAAAQQEFLAAQQRVPPGKRVRE
jgi:tetratricopeptide (TPR) repeat protein